MSSLHLLLLSVICLLLIPVAPAQLTVTSASVTLKETYVYESTSSQLKLLFGSIKTSAPAFVDPSITFTGCSSYGCSSSSYCTASTTILPCCDPNECSSIIPDPGTTYSSGYAASVSTTSDSSVIVNSAGAQCFCPPYLSELGESPVCLDSTAPAQLQLEESDYDIYQVKIDSACHNLMITLNTISGQQLVFATREEEMGGSSEIELSSATSQGAVMCCGSPSDPHALFYEGNVTNSIFIVVYGYITGEYELSVSQIDASNPFYPSDTHYYFANVTLDCNSSSVTGAAPWMPVPDPGYAFYAIRAAPYNYTQYTLPAFRALTHDGVALIGDGAAYTRYAVPDTCTTDWIGVRDSAAVTAQSTDLLGIVLVPTLAGSCDSDDFLLAQAELLNIVTTILPNVTSATDAYALGVLAFALVTSDEFLACVDLVENTLTDPSSISISVTNSVVCPYSPGSSEYAVDPCCNKTVAFLYQCCVPRSFDTETGGFAVNEAMLTSLCNTPSCSRSTLMDYAQYVARQRDSSVGCDAKLNLDLQQLEDLFFGPNNVVAQCNAQLNGSASCTNNASCLYTGICRTNADLKETCAPNPSDKLFLSCMYDQLQALPSVMAAFAYEFLTNAAIDITNRTTFIDTMLSFDSLKGEICFVNGIPSIDPLLTNNPAECNASTLYCNWDPTNRARTDQYSCVEWEAVLGTGYCSINCSSNPTRSECASRSQPTRGCYAPPDGYQAYLPGWKNDTCDRIGGKLDPANGQLCFFAENTTQASCLGAGAPTINMTRAACRIPSLGQLQCNCATIYTQFPAYGSGTTSICRGFQWSVAEGVCQYPVPTAVGGFAAMTYDLCLIYEGNGTVWARGGQWIEGTKQSSTECVGQFVCVGNPSVKLKQKCISCGAAVCRTDLLTKPDVCTNLTLCTSNTCTDFEFRRPYSVCNAGCVVPFTFDSSGKPNACATSSSTSGANSGGQLPIVIGNDPGAISTTATVTGTRAPPCYPGDYPRSVLGCIRGEIGSATDCKAIGGSWYSAAANQTDCVSRKGCDVNGTLTLIPPNECTKCGVTQALYEWRSYSVVNETWAPLVWNPTRQLQSSGTVMTALDRALFLQLISLFVFPRIAEITQNYLLCSIGRQVSALNSLACDCGSPAGTNCYSTQARSLGYATLCTSFDSFDVPPVTIVLAPISTQVICAQLSIGLYASSALQSSSVRLYSSLFLQSLVPDSYSVVKNRRGIVIGQLIGDVVEITEPAPHMSLVVCVELRDSVREDFAVLDFATIDSSYLSKSLVPLQLNAYLSNSTDGKTTACVTLTLGNDTVCPATGTCVARVVPIYRSRTWASDRFIDTLTDPQVRAFFIAAALYWLLFIAAGFRVVNMALWYFLKPNERVNLLGLCVLTVLSFFFFLRGLYFILVPVGVMRNAPIAIDLLMAELPTYLFFSVFTMMVLWWIQLYHDSAALQTSLLGRMYPAFFLVNGFLYAFLIAVVIVVAVRSNKNRVEGACDAAGSGLDGVSDRLSKAYKIIVSVIALALALGFLIYGTRLVLLLRRMTGKNESKANIIKFAIVTAACSLGLILQCALLLYSTFAATDSSNSRTVVALVLLLFIEFLPGAALVGTMRQPRVNSSSWFRSNVAWCCSDPSTMSTSLSSSRRSGHGL